MVRVSKSPERVELCIEDDRFAYRLTIREERPDFTLTASPANPNVPRGGSVAVQVTALRLDGFDKAAKHLLCQRPELPGRGGPNSRS